MSFMTEVILTMSLVEDTGTSGCPIWPAMDFIQKWVADEKYLGGQIFEVNAPQGECGYCPGGVFVGEFKNLHTARFIKAIRAAPWQWREKVRVFIRDERTEVFEPVSLEAETADIVEDGYSRPMTAAEVAEFDKSFADAMGSASK